MPLESASFISQLDATNPAAPDLVADSDNHLRLIKQVLRNSFPNVDAPVTIKPFAFTGVVPIGGIIGWNGAVESIPSGYVLSMGQTGITRSDGEGTINAPDLRDRFLVGAGAAYALGAVGGGTVQAGTASTDSGHVHSGYTDVQGNHTHGGATQDRAISISQMPSHRHPTEMRYARFTVAGAGTACYIDSGGSGGLTNYSEYVGGGDGHNHVINNDGSHQHVVQTYGAGAHSHTISVTDGRPAYYALCWIMKV